MKLKSPRPPSFFIDDNIPPEGTYCRDLLRHTEIAAKPSVVYAWLKQLRIAPYSFDFIDNPSGKSPCYIIENLPPLKVNNHFLLAFHVLEFEEDTFILCRFCEPINKPLDLCLKQMYIEYRIENLEKGIRLWCKIRGYYNRDIVTKGFFVIFSLVNKIMMARQLHNLKRLSENLEAGRVETGRIDLKNYFPATGLHWWIFCRRHNCKGLIM